MFIKARKESELIKAGLYPRSYKERLLIAKGYTRTSTGDFRQYRIIDPDSIQGYEEERLILAEELDDLFTPFIVVEVYRCGLCRGCFGVASKDFINIEGRF